MRQSIILHAAQTYDPDLIVDKEPLGLHAEVEDTLAFLKTRGTRLVLGLRDVMDAPHLLDAEWKRKDLMPPIDQYYDDIWVYGLEEIYDPLIGLEVPAGAARMTFVGFLRREMPARRRRATGPSAAGGGLHPRHHRRRRRRVGPDAT